MENEIMLQEVNGIITTNTRDIADRFKKQHSEVLKKIEGYERTKEDKHIAGLLDQFEPSVNTLCYFIPSEYIDSKGETRKEYLLSRDGFSLLAMGFTGQEALKWKLEYIAAFNKMEQLIKKQLEKALPSTYKEALIQLIESIEKSEVLLIENERLAPLAEFAEQVTESSNAIDIGDFSKIVSNANINIGRNKLFEWFRNQKLLMSDNVPYQKYVDNNWFKVIETTKQTSYGIKCYSKTLITGRGQVQIVKKLREMFCK